MIRPHLVLAGCLATGFPGLLLAQDPATKSPLVTWRVTLPYRRGIAVWVRNPTPKVVLLKAVEVTQCQNIGAGCGRAVLDRSLAPGDSLQMVVIRPRLWDGPYHFAASHEWAEVDGPTGPNPAALPAWAVAAFDHPPFTAHYRLASWMSPPVLEPDLDGDQRSDLAVLIEDLSGRRGVALVRRASPDSIAVVGAGIGFGTGGADFSWLDEWAVRSAKGAVQVLYLGKRESAGGLVRWTGVRYEWEQFGD